ncbi:MAG: hypothetical protein ACQEQU_08435 [Spirochaetota bacterium]
MKKSMMKKLTVLLVVMVVSSGFVFGATTADLDVVGNVAEVVSISVSDSTADLGTLEPDTEKTSSVNVVEKSNNYAGYKVSLASTNGGELRLLDESGEYVNTGDSGEVITYTATYDDVSVDLLSEAYEITSTTTGTTGTDGVTKAFAVSATADSGNYAGDYKDELTFTITAN